MTVEVGSEQALAGREVLLVGAGKMGGALLQGWVDLPLKALRVLEPSPSPALVECCRVRGVTLEGSETRRPADIVVLAVKPQSLDAAAPAASAAVSGGTTLLSVVAGKTVADLKRRFPGAGRIVRAMPNTPAAVGRGITGAFAATDLSRAERAAVTGLLAAVGKVEWLDAESDIDAVTAVSGSGPAYVFFLTECLARAGAAAGLAPALAERLARATVEGAGELMFREAETTPRRLRQNVTSPGGTTAAALDVLTASDGLPALMERAVAAAKRRAQTLGG